MCNTLGEKKYEGYNFLLHRLSIWDLASEVDFKRNTHYKLLCNYNSNPLTLVEIIDRRRVCQEGKTDFHMHLDELIILLINIMGCQH